MKTNGIKIKDFAKAAKAGGADGLMISAKVITDGRMAVAVSELCPEDRAALIAPMEAPEAFIYTNCATEAEAQARDVAAEENRRQLADVAAHNKEVTDRLALLSGVFSASSCQVLPAGSERIFDAPKAGTIALRFNGLIYAPNIGRADVKNSAKFEICVFEEVPADELAGSMASYNLTDPAGRAAYEAEKKRRGEAEARRVFDYENEPEAPRQGCGPSTMDDKEENRAPGALRRVGVNRKYVDFLGLGGGRLVYMEAGRGLAMLFTEEPEEGAQGLPRGSVVMPRRA